MTIDLILIKTHKIKPLCFINVVDNRYRNKKETVMIEVNVKTKHGHLFSCTKCKLFHFEFNQLGIDFSSFKAIKNFSNYLSEISGEMFEQANESTLYNRKIHIPFQGTAIKMLLNSSDLHELKRLVELFIRKYEKQVKQKELLNHLSLIKSEQRN